MDEKIPELAAHEADYQPDAWKAYTVDELLSWVHLLTKRAGMRTDPTKRGKDLYDAENYRAMLRKAIEEWD